jgi:hypothetical protein
MIVKFLENSIYKTDGIQKLAPVGWGREKWAK